MTKEAMCRAVLKLIHEDKQFNVSRISEEIGISRNSLYIAYKSETGSPLREYTQGKYIELLLPYLMKNPDKIFFILMEYYPVYVLEDEPDRNRYANPIIRNVMDWFMTSVSVCYKLNKESDIKVGQRCVVFVKKTSQVWILF